MKRGGHLFLTQAWQPVLLMVIDTQKHERFETSMRGERDRVREKEKEGKRNEPEKESRNGVFFWMVK